MAVGTNMFFSVLKLKNNDFKNSESFWTFKIRSPNNTANVFMPPTP